MNGADGRRRRVATPQAAPTGLGSGPVSRTGVNLANLGKSIVCTSFYSFLFFYLVTFAGLSPLPAGAQILENDRDILANGGLSTHRSGQPHGAAPVKELSIAFVRLKLLAGNVGQGGRSGPERPAADPVWL